MRMPTSVVLTGRLINNGRPVQGLVRCTPERLWVIDQKIPWACLAPEQQLDWNGSFEVRLTATDNDAIPFAYLIETPAGIYRAALPWRKQPYHLKELIDGHRAVPWTPHG